MPTGTITTKGQITIPKEIRDYLQINPGDRLDFIIESDGRAIIQPATIKVQEVNYLHHTA